MILLNMHVSIWTQFLQFDWSYWEIYTVTEVLYTGGNSWKYEIWVQWLTTETKWWLDKNKICAHAIATRWLLRSNEEMSHCLSAIFILLKTSKLFYNPVTIKGYKLNVNKNQHIMVNSICIWTPLREKGKQQGSPQRYFQIFIDTHFSISFFMDEKFIPRQLTTAKENGGEMYLRNFDFWKLLSFQQVCLFLCRLRFWSWKTQTDTTLQSERLISENWEENIHSLVPTAIFIIHAIWIIQ